MTYVCQSSATSLIAILPAAFLQWLLQDAARAQYSTTKHGRLAQCSPDGNLTGAHSRAAMPVNDGSLILNTLASTSSTALSGVEAPNHTRAAKRSFSITYVSQHVKYYANISTHCDDAQESHLNISSGIDALDASLFDFS
jgi:hypothetical protein